MRVREEPHRWSWRGAMFALALWMLRKLQVGVVLTPGTPQDWETTYGPEGMNPYGETPQQVTQRRATMNLLARQQAKELLGRHHDAHSSYEVTGEPKGTA